MNQPTGSSWKFTYPPLGNICSTSEKAITVSRPIRYDGAETPTIDSPSSVRSISVSRLRAAHTPVATPMTSHSTAAPTAIDAVIGKRSRISWLTDSLRRNEYPRHGAEQTTAPPPLPKVRPTKMPAT